MKTKDCNIFLKYKGHCSSFSREVDQFRHNTLIEIWAGDGGHGGERIVGHARASHIQTARARYLGATPMDVFDDTAEIRAIAHALFIPMRFKLKRAVATRFCLHPSQNLDLFYINAIALIPQACGQGIGLRAIEMMIADLGAATSLSVMLAGPIENGDTTRNCPTRCAISKLEDHFAGAGFQLVEDVMVRNSLHRSDVDEMPPVFDLELPETSAKAPDWYSYNF